MLRLFSKHETKDTRTHTHIQLYSKFIYLLNCLKVLVKTMTSLYFVTLASSLPSQFLLVSQSSNIVGVCFRQTGALRVKDIECSHFLMDRKERYDSIMDRSKCITWQDDCYVDLQSTSCSSSQVELNSKSVIVCSFSLYSFIYSFIFIQCLEQKSILNKCLNGL